MKLYQAEWCPFSHRVRAKLSELGIDYELINVPASSKKRRDLEKVAGTTAIPVLVDGQKVISDSDEALSYLEKEYEAEPDELELHHRELSPTVSARSPSRLMRPQSGCARHSPRRTSRFSRSWTSPLSWGDRGPTRS
jgi:glutaredoxin 3